MVRSRIRGYCPRKGHEGSQPFQQVGPHARHAVKSLESAKWAVRGPPGDNALRERWAYPWQPRDLGHVGAVHIYPVTWNERPRKAGSGTRCLM